jgi:thiol-disulfide isomerase/thioredoxin
MLNMMLAVLVAAGSTQAVPAASPLPATPAACATAARELQKTRAKELAPGGMTSQIAQTIAQERQALLKACVAQFDAAKTPDQELAGLAALYAEANQPQQAKAVIDRALAAKGLVPADRAEVLVQAVNVGLREPKGDERNARLETYVDELDRLPAASFDQKFAAHSRMNGFYRADDIDAGIVKHSTWIIDQAARFIDAQRKQYGATVVNAFVNLAQARAGQGQNDEALTLLRRALAEWSDAPSTKGMVQPELERYSLVGTPGAPITAPRWLNRPDGGTTLDLKGKVTLLEFSAHWCGPCRESYPGVNRLRAKYSKDGFQVVLATRLYGYFQAERSLAPETEFERDKAYFAEHGLDVPIAVGDKVDITMENGRTVYLPAPDPNDTAYRVSGIPQIQLIDRQGRIRLIMIGYDDANEGKLAGTVERLLAEK